MAHVRRTSPSVGAGDSRVESLPALGAASLCGWPNPMSRASTGVFETTQMRPGERVCLFLKRSRDTYRGGQLLHTTSMGQGHLTLAAPGQPPGRLQPHEPTVKLPATAADREAQIVAAVR